jgi:membrane protein DedA with SNARE-associated domain
LDIAVKRTSAASIVFPPPSSTVWPVPSAPVDAVFNLMERWVTSYGYVAIFLIMAAESACIPFPSEVTMLVGGWYAAQGRLEFLVVGAAGVLGNVVGSLLAYAVGRTSGRTLVDRYGRYLLIQRHDVDRAEMWWRRYGEAATFFGRLIPVVRTFISLPAGLAGMPLRKFTLYSVLGIIPWVFGLAWLGELVQSNWARLAGYFSLPTLVIIVALIAAAALWYVKRKRAHSAGSAEKARLASGNE